MTQVVWFKRDLRVHDHAPLAQAAARGPVVALHITEPSLLASDLFDASHALFIDQSLAAWPRRHARARFVGVHNSPAARPEADAIQQRRGGRRSGMRMTGQAAGRRAGPAALPTAKPRALAAQRSLFDEPGDVNC